MPLTGYTTGGDPKDEGDKPKKEKPEEKKAKSKSTEDSLDIYKSENKVLDNIEIPSYDRSSNEKDVSSTNSNERLRQNINNNTEAEEEDPNSAMSFNIIYYIIDKFKFTDPLQ
jgi:hypothetical protein